MVQSETGAADRTTTPARPEPAETAAAEPAEPSKPTDQPTAAETVAPSQQTAKATAAPSETTDARAAGDGDGAARGGDGRGGRREGGGNTGDAAAGAGNADDIRARYLAKLQARLAAAKEYPRRARLRHEEGVAEVRFAIDKQGRLLSYEITRSSGHTRLDRAAIAMLKRATPLPPIPDELGRQRLELPVPVRFALR
jgi:protein TonB